jgi:hypothetical protein
MGSDWLSSMFPGTKDKGDASPASTLKVTKIVSISLVLFAAITQALEAIGVISLSTTQQVTIWLVAGGLIVLLSIADMACRSYVTAKMSGSGEHAPPQPGQGPQVPVPAVSTDGPGTPTPVPSTGGNAGDDPPASQNGPRIPVKMAEMFPGGCYLVPASISETYDYDMKTRTYFPSIDKITGQRVYQCWVVDMDPERKGWSRVTLVKIVADQMPVPPTKALYGAVEFEGLTATPHTADRGRTAYTSLRATGIKQAIPRGTADGNGAPGTDYQRTPQ